MAVATLAAFRPPARINSVRARAGARAGQSAGVPLPLVGLRTATGQAGLRAVIARKTGSSWSCCGKLQAVADRRCQFVTDRVEIRRRFRRSAAAWDGVSLRCRRPGRERVRPGSRLAGSPCEPTRRTRSRWRRHRAREASTASGVVIPQILIQMVIAGDFDGPLSAWPRRARADPTLHERAADQCLFVAGRGHARSVFRR